jgi:hypothetical protein
MVPVDRRQRMGESVLLLARQLRRPYSISMKAAPPIRMTSQTSQSRRYRVSRSMAFNKRSAVNKSLEIGQRSAGLELERGTEAPRPRVSMTVFLRVIYWPTTCNECFNGSATNL